MLSRRQFATIGAAGVATVAGAAKGLTHHWGVQPTATPQPRPGLGAFRTTKFGALVQLPDESATMADWTRDVDAMVRQGQTLVRCGPASWLIAPAPGRWSDVWTRSCQDALDYAIARGMTITMVLPGCPDWAQKYSNARYLSACREFWSGMQVRFGSRVEIFQVFNEPDGSHYRYFDEVSVTAAYLSELATLLDAARTIFGAPGPSAALTTTNLLGWPMNAEREGLWNHRLDQLAPHLDVIGLDTYPADNWSEILALPDRIRRIQRRYGKPVYICELGLQTTGDWDAADQARYVGGAVTALKQAHPWGIALYRWRDTVDDAFGLESVNGVPKEGFAKVVATMRSS